MSHWSFAASVPVLLLGLAIWVGSAWLCYSNWRRSGVRKKVVWLESLRFLTITILTLTLLRPEFVRQLQRTTAPEVAVLLDASGSMQTRDVILSNNVISRAEWINLQHEDQLWKHLQKDAKVLVEDFATHLPATNGPRRAPT